MEKVKSLDQIEKELFEVGKAPFEYEETRLSVTDSRVFASAGNKVFSLNGEYTLIDGGDEQPDFSGGITANVPSTVQTALFENGLIPDPMFGKNDKFARQAAYKIWWYKKEFDYNGECIRPTLCFDGVCHKAHFWLNGKYLGSHEGMFGGPFFRVDDILEIHNTLIVKIENSPADPKHYSEYADYDDGWKNGVVINCVYGWHYACIPTRGIWADVYLSSTPKLSLERPYILTEDYKTGKIGICTKAVGENSGTVNVKISPKNFKGKEQFFTGDFSVSGEKNLHFTLNVDNPKLWWPNGYGEQPLYNVTVSFETDDDLVQEFNEVIGIRQIKMLPENGTPKSDHYNWKFTINGKYIFIKGTNWCTTDALLRCTNERYDRFLTLAKHQNLQLLRAWGGGLPESDYFYAKCDELGLMVQQEWPTCWDSPKTQPAKALIETAYLNTIRIRNHPSLVRWAGGNELSECDEPSMKRMAQLAFELDGARPFHRTSPYAGSLHSYGTYWEMEEMDSALNLRAPFIGEFGMASAPNYESVLRYIPPEEANQTIDRNAKTCFNYHSPRFNEFLWPENYNDLDHLLMRSSEFLDIKDIKDFVLGTQLAQATAIRHTLEGQRADIGAYGVCYYKLTDVYPACSWSTVDYYGVPKIPYYIIKNAFAPIHAMLEIKSITAADCFNIYLLDDNAKLSDKEVSIKVNAFDGNLKQIAETKVETVPKSRVNSVGEFKLDQKQQEDVRFISVRLFEGENLIDDTFYILNYKNKNCLKSLPQADLKAEVKDEFLYIKNCSDVPAVGVFIENIKNDTKFTAQDNFLFIHPKSERKIKVNIMDGISVRALNSNGEKYGND